MVIEPRIFLGSLRYKINQFVENVIWVYGDIPPNHIWVWKWCPKMALEFWGRWGSKPSKFEATLFLERPNRPTKKLKWNSTVPALKSASLLTNSQVLYWIWRLYSREKNSVVTPHTPIWKWNPNAWGGWKIIFLLNMAINMGSMLNWRSVTFYVPLPQVRLRIAGLPSAPTAQVLPAPTAPWRP